MCKSKFLQSKAAAFNSVIHSDLAKKHGANYALIKAGYNLDHQANLTRASKGRGQSVYANNPSQAHTTLVHSKNVIR